MRGYFFAFSTDARIHLHHFAHELVRVLQHHRIRNPQQTNAEQGSKVAQTCSCPRLFVVMGGRTADLQNRSALHVVEQSIWPYNAQTTLVFGVPGDGDVLLPSPPSLATPFPTGRKSAAGIVKSFPTGRKFRKNSVDDISRLCDRLGGVKSAVAGNHPGRQVTDTPPESGGELLARLDGRLHPWNVPV